MNVEQRLGMTRKEAAGMLGVSERTIYDMTRRGQLRAFYIGRLPRYTVEDLQSCLAGLPAGNHNPNREPVEQLREQGRFARVPPKRVAKR